MFNWFKKKSAPTAPNKDAPSNTPTDAHENTQENAASDASADATTDVQQNTQEKALSDVMTDAHEPPQESTLIDAPIDVITDSHENTQENATSDTPTDASIDAHAPLQEPTPTDAPIETSITPVSAKPSYFERLKQGLSKTRDNFADLFLGKKTLDADFLEELENRLLSADLGIESTNALIESVQQSLKRNELKDQDAVRHHLAQQMTALLEPYAKPIAPSSAKPYVILMIGINGAGKTTTIGKLSHLYQQQGKKVILAAGDTFRAAAVEQLQNWGERHQIPVIAQGTGADSASVAYDALESAKAKQADMLIIDTAGRLHTQDLLMDELKKIKKVINKLDHDAPHETLLVLDAGNGQNALRQALSFHQHIGIDGIILTKLDGTAKGGIVFAITEKLKLPIRFIGVGEQAQDLRAFNPSDFVNALLYPHSS